MSEAEGLVGGGLGRMTVLDGQNEIRGDDGTVRGFGDTRTDNVSEERESRLLFKRMWILGSEENRRAEDQMLLNGGVEDGWLGMEESLEGAEDREGGKRWLNKSDGDQSAHGRISFIF